MGISRDSMHKRRATGGKKKPLECLSQFLSECFTPTPPPRPNEANLEFMVIVLRVDVRSLGWQKGVNKVLSSAKKVREFRLMDDGKVIVSGIVDPPLLMKMLGKAGKSAKLEWFQYGQCSSNLFLPPPPPKSPINNGVQNQEPFRNFIGNRHPGFALPHHGGFHGLPPPPPPPPLLFAPHAMHGPPVFYEHDSRDGHKTSNCNTM